MKSIKGPYECSYGFTTVYCENRIYTIASNGNWGSVGVGELTATNHLLTQEEYDKRKNGCEKEGTFELE